ncbi:MAG: hypothetical protein HND54_08695 [Bacteroidetes bacterium]|nr:hypothetical protein [Flavobacteriales bacterium]NOG57796.1 hypothetical protein [Bacteroidota bacterium]
MNQYKIIKKGVFEKESSFEERMNSMAREGWRALSVAVQGGVMVVLMEKNR